MTKHRAVPVIVRALTFPAPPDAVWGLLVDLERQPSWMRDLKSITPSSAGPLAVGFRAVGRVRMFGVTQEDPIEVAYFEPGRHFGMTHGGGYTGRMLIDGEIYTPREATKTFLKVQKPAQER